MLNKKAITETLARYPLCHGALIQQRGLAIEYCAMGALARGVGVTDQELRRYSSRGEDLFNDNKIAINHKYGIESYSQFAAFMTANDSAKNSLTRNDEVIKVIDALSPEEVNDLLLVSTEV